MGNCVENICTGFYTNSVQNVQNVMYGQYHHNNPSVKG